jgi:hypothetical protein
MALAPVVQEVVAVLLPLPLLLALQLAALGLAERLGLAGVLLALVAQQGVRQLVLQALMQQLGRALQAVLRPAEALRLEVALA